MIRTVHTFVEDVPDTGVGGVTRRAVVVAVVLGRQVAQEDAQVQSLVRDLVAEPTESGEGVRSAAEGLAPGDDFQVGGMRITLVDAPRTDELLVISWRTGPIAMPALPSLAALLTSHG